jgi:DNA-binding NarL/FixJ family response regulator
MISVLIADDHEVVRRGIRQLLEQEPDVHVRGEAGSGREALEAAVKLKPHVVVLDMSMPGLNGLDATRQLRRALPDTEVLIYTMHGTEQLVREVVSAGARGYVLKSDPARELVAAVKALGSHRPYFTTLPTEAVLHGFLHAGEQATEESDAYGGPLTAREREILQLLAEGMSNREIATTLDISEKTVETHRAAIMRKLGVTSVVKLVHYAVRNHLIEL